MWAFKTVAVFTKIKICRNDASFKMATDFHLLPVRSATLSPLRRLCRGRSTKWRKAQNPNLEISKNRDGDGQQK